MADAQAGHVLISHLAGRHLAFYGKLLLHLALAKSAAAPVVGGQGGPPLLLWHGSAVSVGFRLGTAI